MKSGCSGIEIAHLLTRVECLRHTRVIRLISATGQPGMKPLPFLLTVSPIIFIPTAMKLLFENHRQLN